MSPHFITYLVSITYTVETVGLPTKSAGTNRSQSNISPGTKRPRHHISGAGVQEEVVEFGGTRECRRREGSAQAHGEGSFGGNIFPTLDGSCGRLWTTNRGRHGRGDCRDVGLLLLAETADTIRQNAPKRRHHTVPPARRGPDVGLRQSRLCPLRPSKYVPPHRHTLQVSV